MAATPRGFAAMDPEQQRKIASQGGKASSGSFDNDPKRASEAGKKGAAAQPVEAKRLGGTHSHRNR
ncbi:general stress protein [Nocardia sp. NPDC050712]|uniref:general stress protein n=1 Tax=Nocardia sp. NPDC050712 TaxID=3155518 RepID=UPI0033E14C22